MNKKADLKDCNVLLVSHEMTYTGAPRSLLNIAKILKKSVRSIHVWTINDGIFKKEFEAEGIEVQRVPLQIEESEVSKYQIVILNTIFTAHLVKEMQQYTRTILYIREAMNIPFLVEMCKLSIDDLLDAKEIVCVSEYAEKFIKENYNPKRLSIIHNWVPDEYAGKLNIVRDGIIHFMISGTYERRKGYETVIDAFLMMPDELKGKTRLHLVGPMPDWSKDYWEMLRNRYDARIIEHGAIVNEEERIRLYKRMNVFIVASKDEACSLVALEGAMLGKVVLMSENTGAQYLDVKKKGIFKTNDIADLAWKMCQLTSRRELILRGLEMRVSYMKTSTCRRFERDLLNYLSNAYHCM